MEASRGIATRFGGNAVGICVGELHLMLLLLRLLLQLLLLLLLLLLQQLRALLVPSLNHVLHHNPNQRRRPVSPRNQKGHPNTTSLTCTCCIRAS